MSMGVIENGCLNRIEQNPLVIYVSVIGLGVGVVVGGIAQKPAAIAYSRLAVLR